MANGVRTCCFVCSKKRDSKASSDRDFDYLTPFYPGVKCTTYRCENVLFRPGYDALLIPYYEDRAYWSCIECHRLAKMNEPFGPIPDFTEDNAHGDMNV